MASTGRAVAGIERDDILPGAPTTLLAPATFGGVWVSVGAVVGAAADVCGSAAEVPEGTASGRAIADVGRGATADGTAVR